MTTKRMFYDDCDAVLSGVMWIFKCGFMVHDRILNRKLTGAQEEYLSNAHRKHHGRSIGVRVGDHGVKAHLGGRQNGGA